MNEQELIRKAQKGNGDAFSELMGAHEQRMYGLCLRMSRSAQDAQDFLQEAMIKIYRSIKSFKGDSQFSTWVYSVTRNACLDELRKRKAQPTVSADSLIDQGWNPVSSEPTPEQSAVRNEKRAMLASIIRELPEEMRTVIIMRDVEHMAYDEIADVLGINLGTVKSRINRARSKLREEINKVPELL